MLTSGSTARGLLALAPDETARDLLLATPVVAIGEPTAEAARSLGFATVLTAPAPGAPALARFVAASLGLAPGLPRRPERTAGRNRCQPALGGSR